MGGGSGYGDGDGKKSEDSGCSRVKSYKCLLEGENTMRTRKLHFMCHVS